MIDLRKNLCMSLEDTLNSVGLSELAALFKREDVDADALAQLTEEDLKGFFNYSFTKSKRLSMTDKNRI
jgi:hypothetical protein